MESRLVKSQTSLELKRTYQAPVALVYRAWTEPERMNHWFHPNLKLGCTCRIDLQVGGRYEIRMHREAGEPAIVSGEYQEIIPQEKLVFTWRWQGDETNEETLVTVLFQALGERETLLTLRHERFTNEHERDEHATGWQGVFDHLSTVLD